MVRKPYVLLGSLVLLVSIVSGCGGNNNDNGNAAQTPAAQTPATQTPGTATGGAGGDKVAGKTIFENNCMACHGRGGENGHNGPNLKTSQVSKNTDQIIDIVMNGRKVMPAFKNTLSEKQINDLAAYINQEIASK